MGSRLGNVQRSSFLQNSRKSFVFYPLVHALIEDLGGVCGWPRRTVRVTRIRALITSSDCAMCLEFLSRKDGLCWDLRMKGYSILRVSPRNSCSRGPKNETLSQMWCVLTSPLGGFSEISIAQRLWKFSVRCQSINFLPPFLTTYSFLFIFITDKSVFSGAFWHVKSTVCLQFHVLFLLYKPSC